MKIISSEKLYSGYFSMNKYQLTDGTGLTFDREVFNHPEGVCAVVYDTIKQKYLFVEQFRVAAKIQMIELVAGSIDKNESPQETMVREIEEELGYLVDKIKFINEFYVSPGSNTEKVYLYYAEVSEQINQGGGVDNENITVIEVDTLSKDGQININGENIKLLDAKTIIGCCLV
jgi:ADP-ribose pyrophosphatase